MGKACGCQEGGDTGAAAGRAGSAAAGNALLERLQANQAWTREKSPAYFSRLVGIKEIEVLWIGCSDARLPANELIGLEPGEVFVHRSLGNLATHQDMNAQSCIEYAVRVLKVKHIIVCGHYGCDAVRGALMHPAKTEGLVNLWVGDIRATRDANVESLRRLPSTAAQADRLVELNVLRQVFNVCTSPIVQQAWDAGQPLAVHGLVYSLADGLLRPLYTTDSAPSRPGTLYKPDGPGISSSGGAAAAPGGAPSARSSGDSPGSVAPAGAGWARSSGSLSEGSGCCAAAEEEEGGEGLAAELARLRVAA